MDSNRLVTVPILELWAKWVKSVQGNELESAPAVGRNGGYERRRRTTLSV